MGLQEAKLELKKSKRKDYYKILGVEKSANDDEIKKAYRKRAMVHHPDRHSSASDDEKKEHETKFKEVGEAYAILSDEKKRRMYDSGQDLEDGGCGGGFHDVDPKQHLPGLLWWRHGRYGGTSWHGRTQFPVRSRRPWRWRTRTELQLPIRLGPRSPSSRRKGSLLSLVLCLMCYAALLHYSSSTNLFYCKLSVSSPSPER